MKENSKNTSGKIGNMGGLSKHAVMILRIIGVESKAQLRQRGLQGVMNIKGCGEQTFNELLRLNDGVRGPRPLDRRKWRRLQAKSHKGYIEGDEHEVVGQRGGARRPPGGPRRCVGCGEMFLRMRYEPGEWCCSKECERFMVTVTNEGVRGGERVSRIVDEVLRDREGE